MKCRSNAAFLLVAFVAAVSLCGCRTTVENYRNAYQTALEKKNSEVADDILPPGAVMMDIDGPAMTIHEGDTIYIETRRLSFPDSVMTMPYNVIAGIYTIETNARGHRNQLLREYPDATIARDADSRIYVISGSFARKDAAMRHAAERKKQNGVVFPGMKRVPLIIELPGARNSEN